MIAKGVQLSEDQFVPSCNAIDVDADPLTRARLRHKANLVHPNDADAVQSLEKKRQDLLTRITAFRRIQIRLMPTISELLEGYDTDGTPAEDIPIALPSWFSEDERVEFDIDSRLAKFEYEIRQAHAETVLAELRLSIRTFGAWADEAKLQLDSSKDKTRAGAALQKMRSKQRSYIAIYKDHLHALRGLGLKADDATYRDLDATMLAAHLPTTKPQQGNVGKGQRDEAWFWRGELDVAAVSTKNQVFDVTADDGTYRRASPFRFNSGSSPR